MKLRINNFQNDLNLFDGYVNVIEITNTNYFSKLIQSINEKINGYENNEIILLTDDNKIMKFEKEVLLLIDLFNIDVNNKKIISTIYNIISENVKKSQDYEFEMIINNLRHYIDMELMEFPFEFQMKETLEVEDILKVFALKIESKSYHSIKERIELFIDLMSNFKISSILIIPNLKLYVTPEEIVEIYKYSIYNEIKLVLIERECNEKLEYEQIMCIDESFDDYIY